MADTGLSGGRDTWSPPLAEAPDEPRSAVLACLREVLDPELPVSVVDLGLVYDVEMRGRSVSIDLTFTATACPCMDFIRTDVSDRLRREPWIDEVRIREVWDPPWTVDRVSPEGRRRLREFGVGV